MAKRGKFVRGTFLGAVIGGIAGLLLAPKSGKETRRDIEHKTKEVTDGAGKQVKSAERRARRGVKRAKRGATKTVRRANRTARQAKRAARKATGQAKRTAKRTARNARPRRGR